MMYAARMMRSSIVLMLVIGCLGLSAGGQETAAQPPAEAPDIAGEGSGQGDRSDAAPAETVEEAPLPGSEEEEAPEDAEEVNYLLNPGFEQLADGLPVGWMKYVKPAEGAEAGVSSDAFAGDHCVFLRTAQPYPGRDPINNWSQTVAFGLAGKRLELSGRIRGDSVREVALWLQCIRSPRTSVVAFATTSSERPILGSTNWKQVAVELDVPEETSYLVVRCIMKGSGAAWFDDLALRQVAEPDGEEGQKKENEAPDAPAEKKAPVDVDALSEQEEETPEAPAEPEPAQEKPQPEEGLSEEALLAIIESQRVLLESHRELQESNEALMQEVNRLRERLEGMSEPTQAPETLVGEQAPDVEDGAEANSEAGADAAAPPEAEQGPPPPLVPVYTKKEESAAN
jgi:hypothetical protein